jgi:hypothetical protein
MPHLREAAKNLDVGHLMLQFATMNKDLAKYNPPLLRPQPMDHSSRAPASGVQPKALAAE